MQAVRCIRGRLLSRRGLWFIRSQTSRRRGLGQRQHSRRSPRRGGQPERRIFNYPPPRPVTGGPPARVDLECRSHRRAAGFRRRGSWIGHPGGRSKRDQCNPGGAGGRSYRGEPPIHYLYQSKYRSFRGSVWSCRPCEVGAHAAPFVNNPTNIIPRAEPRDCAPGG